MFSRGGCPDGEVGFNSHFCQEIVKHMFITDSRVHMYPGNSQTFGQFSGWEIKMQHNVLENLVVLEHYLNSPNLNSMIYCEGFLDLFFLIETLFFPSYEICICLYIYCCFWFKQNVQQPFVSGVQAAWIIHLVTREKDNGYKYRNINVWLHSHLSYQLNHNWRYPHNMLIKLTPTLTRGETSWSLLVWSLSVNIF